MATEAQRRASAKYKAKYQRRWLIGVNRRTEPDLLEHLESLPNVQGYIKGLIRADMSKGSE